MSFHRFLLFLLAALLLVACTSPEEIPEINVGHAPHDHHAALYIAASRPNFFQKNANVYLKEITYHQRYELYVHNTLLARLNLVCSTGGAQLVRKLTERQLDICFGGVPAMIQAIDSGSPLCILMPLMTGGAGLMLRKDIPVKNWPEFVTYLSRAEAPVRIGYKTASSVQNLILEQALEFEKIPFSQHLHQAHTPLVLINMYGAANLIPAMRNGILDGFVVMEPFLTLAHKELGARTICSLDQLPPEGQWSEYPCCALAAVDRTFVSDQNAIATAMVQLVRLAHDYIQTHPLDAAKVVAKWLDQPEEIERLSLPSIHFLNTFTPAWRAGVRFWIQTLIASGKLTGKVAVAEEQGKLDKLLYDTGPLKQASRNSL